jgi:Lrp/AsnC family transcriptional regulator, regulator for asnA, asnC and gidA
MIDNTNKAILNVLLENSRLSYRQIGKRVGVSVATVMNRVRELENKGIIKKYSVLLDYDKLGYDIEVIIDVRISKGKFSVFASKVRNEPNVFGIYDNTGHFDATILARFQNRRGVDAFLKKVQHYEFVERTETKMILSVIKEGGISV